MVKIDLITGFLGSGKTTFLMKYARFLMDRGEKLGILEYDFGPINIDMVELNKLRGPKCEIEMVAAACDEDCLRRRFKTKLISMAMSGYDRVIVEPSGIFDMDMFYDILRDDPLEQWYEISNVIATVNANLEDDLSPEEEFVLASQAMSAGKILLTRTDIATPERIENTKARVLLAAEKIKCKKMDVSFIDKPLAEFEEADFIAIADSGYRINDYVKTIAGGVSSFSSVHTLEPPVGLENTKQKVDALFSDKKFGNIIRVKGFISDNGPCYQFNATRSEVSIAAKANGTPALIIIGTNLDREKILAFIGK